LTWTHSRQKTARKVVARMDCPRVHDLNVSYRVVVSGERVRRITAIPRVADLKIVAVGQVRMQMAVDFGYIEGRTIFYCCLSLPIGECR